MAEIAENERDGADDASYSTTGISLDGSMCVLEISIHQNSVTRSQWHNTLNDVDEVYIYIIGEFTSISDAHMDYLEEILSRTTGVLKVSLSHVRNEVFLEIQHLSRLLQMDALSGVDSVSCKNLHLRGNFENWQVFCQTLQNLQELTKFRMSECDEWIRRFPQDGWEAWARACATHPTLDYLSTNLFSFLSLQSIDSICNSINLNYINWKRCDKSPEQLIRFLAGMQHNSTMKDLSISFKQAMTMEQTRAIVGMLKQNTAISSFELVNLEKVKEDAILQLIHGMKDANVKHFLWKKYPKTGPITNQTCRSSISAMLEQNTKLWDCFISNIFDDDDLPGEVDMFTTLNRCGREQLMQQTCQTKWVEFLARKSIIRDIDCIFYLLSKNPALFFGGQFKSNENTARTLVVNGAKKRKRTKISTSERQGY